MLVQRSTANALGPAFFQLPRELRDSIYDYLFQGNSFTILNKNVRPDLGVTFHFFYQFNGTREHLNHLPHWLFACRQMLHEGQQQWYRGANCSPCFCSSSNGRTLAGSYAAAFCELDRVQSFDGPVLTTNFSADWDYFLWPSLPMSKMQLQTIVPRMSEHWVSYSVLDCFFRYLQQHPDHPAKQIKLSLMITPSDSLRKGIGAVDLSYFETLGPRFDRVVFRIVCPYTASYASRTGLLGSSCAQMHVNSSIFPKLQREAVRVGKALVGATETTGWHLRDYLEPMRTSSDDVIPNAFEWHVEVTRRSLQRSGQGELQFQGLRFCRLEHRRHKRREFDYFRPLQIDARGRVTSWVCDDTSDIMSLFA